MELKQYPANDLNRAVIPAWCSALQVYSVCEDDEPVVYVLYEEIEPVKKAA